MNSNRQNIERSSRHWRRRHGGALLEAALAMLMLCYLAFGLVEFGYFFYVKHILAQAVTQGGMTASLPTTYTSDVSNTVAAVISAAGLPSGYTVTTSPTEVNNAAATATVSVQVSYPWSVAGAGYRPMMLISGTRTVSSTAVLRRQY